MMLRQCAVLLFAMASVVVAQDESSSAAPTSSSTRTSSAAAATHTIKVGWPIGQHAFSPENTVAKLRDKIVFEMYPKNHSVVRMDRDAPCVPYDVGGNHAANEAWWSGFFPVGDSQKPGEFDIVVDTTDPIWFYCSAPESCIKYQMVGVINGKNPDQDIEAVKAGAAKADFVLSPGEPIPDESGNVSDSQSSAAASSDDDDSSSLSGGAIAGIVIGAVAAFALVGLLFFFVGHKKKATELKNRTEAADAEAAAKQQPQLEHPPMYQDQAMDPRYSYVPPGSPPPESWNGTKPGHVSTIPDVSTERNPNRLSELPSQNYDPVEIYTPGLPEHTEVPQSPAVQSDAPEDRRRDTLN